MDNEGLACPKCHYFQVNYIPQLSAELHVGRMNYTCVISSYSVPCSKALGHALKIHVMLCFTYCENNEQTGVYDSINQ